MTTAPAMCDYERGSFAQAGELQEANMPDKSRSLSDAEIRSTFTQYGQQYHDALVRAKTLYDSVQDQEETAQSRISVADLRKIVLALFAFQKLLAEPGPQLREGIVTGDRGSGCDYNPFNKVDW
jgi:hypothetical protein